MMCSNSIQRLVFSFYDKYDPDFIRTFMYFLKVDSKKCACLKGQLLFLYITTQLIRSSCQTVRTVRNIAIACKDHMSTSIASSINQTNYVAMQLHFCTC